MDNLKIKSEAGILVANYLLSHNYPQEIPRKLIRSELNTRLNDMIQRDELMYMGTYVGNSGKRPKVKGLISDAIRESFRECGYAYDESEKCYIKL